MIHRTKEPTAADLMTAPVQSVNALDCVQDVAALFTDRAIGAAIVNDADGTPIGVITKTDLVRHEQGRFDLPAEDRDLVERWMTPAIFFVAKDTPRRDVAREMVRYGTHHVMVKDVRTDAIVGIISSFDVLRDLAFGQTLRKAV